MTAARDGHAARPVNPPPAPPPVAGARQAVELGRMLGQFLRDVLEVGARGCARSDEARQRLRGMVERNTTRPTLTVRRDDLRAVLDELDAHRARLAAGGEQ